MNNIIGKSKKIIKVLFFYNAFMLIISIFYIAKWLIITYGIINLIFLGSFLIIEKYADFFGIMIETQKAAKGLNNFLGKITWANI